MERSSDPVFFGEWLKQRRKALDLTQAELAELAGCSIFTLRKFESGERRPSKQLAGLLAAPLDIPPELIPTFIRVARGELNLERLGAYARVKATRIGSPDFEPPPPSNLPQQLTLIIGRTQELEAVNRLFGNPQCRLLTLTGAGGIGKTRLAVEAARQAHPAFPSGVFYVPLAGIDSAEAIVPAIAEAFNLTFSGTSDPKEQLLQHLLKHASRPLLLVLDNYEHLLKHPAGAGKSGAVILVADLLQRLPQLVVLATSRERLNLHGEWTYELHGLPVPADLDSDQPQHYGAVALFAQSACRIRSDFVLTPANQPDVIRLCQLLGGNPLAIELAAAWVGVLPCQEILREVEMNIEILRSDMRDIPERHRSIQASFEHSWRLLTADEQKVLCRLSVFRGGFDRQAAAPVAGATLAHLASLLAKSLVRCSEEGRYDLHEVIRQLSRARLNTFLPDSDVYTRHSQWYLQYVAQRERALKNAGQQQAKNKIVTELDNIRAAWHYALQHGMYAQVEAATRSLTWFFEVAGLLNEGIELVQPLVDPQQAAVLRAARPRLLGLACMQQGLLYFRKGQFTRAFQRYQESIEYLRLADDQALLADALTFLGIMVHLKGEYQQAYAHLSEALACAEAAADPWSTAYARYNMGYIDSVLGEYQAGYQKMMEGLHAWRQLGDPHSIALGLNYLVTTQIVLDRHAEARANMQESIQMCQQSHDRWGLGSAFRFNGRILVAQGDFQQAQVELHKSLEVFRDYVTGWDIACTLSYLADAQRLAGERTQARETYLEALQIAIESDAHPIALETLLGLAHLLAASGDCEQAIRLAYYVLTDQAATQETRQQAQRLLTSLAITFRGPAPQPGSPPSSFDQLVDEILDPD